jgi:predicted PurR-regulated permease PerM
MTDTSTPAQIRARLALAAAIAAAAVWIGWAFIPAVLWAGVVAIAVEPLRRRALDRFPGHDAAVAAAITAAVVLIVVVPLAMAVTQAVTEAQGLSAWFASAKANGIPVPAWVQNLPIGSKQLSGWWDSHLATSAAAAEQFARLDSDVLIEKSKSLGHNVVERVIVFGFTVTILWFMIRDRDGIVAQLERAATRAFGDAGRRVGRQILISVRGAVDGLVLLGLAQGIIMAVVYAIAGVPHPILMGLLSGAASIIPFGLVVVMLVALLMLVVKGAIVTAIVVGVAGFIINFCIDHFLRPGMIGGATKLPFVWVLIGIVGGVETIGLLGLFVGPAVMAALVLIWREWVEDGTIVGGPAADGGTDAGTAGPAA